MEKWFERDDPMRDSLREGCGCRAGRSVQRKPRSRENGKLTLRGGKNRHDAVALGKRVDKPRGSFGDGWNVNFADAMGGCGGKDESREERMIDWSRFSRAHGLGKLADSEPPANEKRARDPH